MGNLLSCHYMRKLRDMEMQVYLNRVVELNNYLERFPRTFNATQKIDDDEIVDILDFGTPNKWQNEMVHLSFDSAVANSQELVEFCEQLEFDEDLNEKPEAKPKPGPSGGNTGRSYTQPKSSREGATSKQRKNDYEHSDAYDLTKYCTLHGKYGHDLNNYKVMLNQEQKMCTN